jgi:uncharacterized protein (TIGR03083 family)
MPQLSSDRLNHALEAGAGALAAIVSQHDQSLPVPTCPDWTLRQLATHVGRAHRWAAEITRTRSAEAIGFRQVPDGRFPDDTAEQDVWLRTGAQRLVGAVREAGRDVVWSFTGLVPAGFWLRRMAHETLVHLADAQLAAGQDPEPGIVPALAADAIDEWLRLMSGPLGGDSDPRADALAAGAALHVHATDDGLDGQGEWLVRHGPDGVTVESGHGKADAALSGPAGSLLLVLMRRRPATAPEVTVSGDASVLSGWLDRTRF